MEFQAVLLAGSQGNRLYPLCEESPPCLLTVATRPLLHFQLDHLSSTGFLECIIVTRTPFLRAIAASVDSWRATRHGHVTSAVAGAQRLSISNASAVPSASATSSSSPSFHVRLEHLEGWTGTCSALRHIRHLLHADFFCLQSDLITSIPLHHLADIHRSRDASVTALLLEPKPVTSAHPTKKKQSDEEDHDTHFIGLVNESSTSRILYYKSSLDLDDNVLSLHKSLLRRSQRLTVHSGLKDAHLYLFAHWVLNVLEDKPLMMSVQSDLVPYLVKSQHRPALLQYRTGRDDDEHLAIAMSHSAPKRDPDEVYRCYVYTTADHYCRRATSITAYRDMNLDLMATEDDDLLTLLATENHATSLSKHFTRAQIAQSFIALNVTLPADAPVTLRKSCVGRGVRIGSGVKLTGCIVTDGVVIEDGVVMTDSIVSEGCIIGKGSTIANCKIGPRYTLLANEEHKNEVLAHERDDQ